MLPMTRKECRSSIIFIAQFHWADKKSQCYNRDSRVFSLLVSYPLPRTELLNLKVATFWRTRIALFHVCGWKDHSLYKQERLRITEIGTHLARARVLEDHRTGSNTNHVD